MLTAAGAPDDRVGGLNLGADDYLAKPFHFPELVARVSALSRRAPSAPPVLRRSELTLDRPRRAASRNGQLVPLTRKELGNCKARSPSRLIYAPADTGRGAPKMAARPGCAWHRLWVEYGTEEFHEGGQCINTATVRSKAGH